MRVSPVLAVSAVLLAVTASAPAWAAGSATPTPAPSASTPPPTATPAPTQSPTPAPSPSGPPPATGYSGSLAITPKSGPAGTKISITPSGPCVAKDGTVVPLADVILMTKAHFDSPKPYDPDVERLVATDDSGAWTTTLTVPASAKAGVTYVVDAICLTAADTTGVPVRIYKETRFLVSSAPAAPVATPVTGTPKFTG